MSDVDIFCSIVKELYKTDDMFYVRDFYSMDNSNDLRISFENNETYNNSGFVSISCPFRFCMENRAATHCDDVCIYFDSLKDYKSFLFDIRFFIKAGAAHAMQTTITDSGYSIRQYFVEENKKLLVWEISNNYIPKFQTIKCYINTIALLEILDENIFGSYGGDGNVNMLEYGPFYSAKYEDFRYPFNIKKILNNYKTYGCADFSQLPKEDQDKYKKVIDNYLNNSDITVKEFCDDIDLTDLEVAYERAKRNNDTEAAAELFDQIEAMKKKIGASASLSNNENPEPIVSNKEEFYRAINNKLDGYSHDKVYCCNSTSTPSKLDKVIGTFKYNIKE